MDKTMQVQAQIRHNAEGISSALSDMSKWEKQIKLKDKKLTEQAASGSRAPVRAGAGTVSINSAAPSVQSSSKSDELTPFTMANKFSSASTPTSVPVIAKALGVHHNMDPEEAERERGNQDFKNGNFTAAVKSYTKCLGLKSRNYVAFSNRAMAYLKLKEFNRAVVDCNSALNIDPNHVKSLLRRATAFNSLGKHRAALKDLLLAIELEPSSKQARSEIQVTKELLRSAVNRAPLVSVPVDFGGQSSENGFDVMQGPDPKPAISDSKSTSASVDSPTKKSVSFEADNPIPAPIESKAVVKDENSDTASLSQYYHANNPVNLPPAPPTSGEVTHRIPIIVEDDDEDDEDGIVEIKINSFNNNSNSSEEVKVEEIGSDSVENIIRVEKESSKVAIKKKVPKVSEVTTTNTLANSNSGSKKSVKSPSSKSTSTKKYTSYDLLRELTNSRMNLRKLSLIFSNLKVSSVPSLLQGLMETDLLFMLLKAVYVLYIGGEGVDAEEFPPRYAKLVAYYEAICSAASFKLVYSLLLADEKKIIENYLNDLQSKVAKQDTELIASVEKLRSVYCK